MSKNREAAIRYRVLNNCLKNKFRKFPTKEELREACCEALGVSDISTRTIEQDLYEMRYNEELGFLAPIEYSRKDRGYYYSEEDYSIDKIPLNSDDIDAIQFASSIFENFRKVSIFSEFSGAVDKLIDSINIKRHASEKDKLDFIQFDNAGYIPGGEHLQTFIKVIKENNVVRLRYRKYQQDTGKDYTFHPYFLKQFDNFWFVLGWVEEYQDTRTFALDRIVETEILPKGFDINPIFDKEEYYQNVYGVTQNNDRKVEQIELLFSKQQGNYIKTIPVHDSQEILEDNEEGLKVRLSLKPNFEIKAKILSYGASVKVISPQSFKDDIKEEVKKTLAKYG